MSSRQPQPFNLCGDGPLFCFTSATPPRLDPRRMIESSATSVPANLPPPIPAQSAYRPRVPVISSSTTPTRALVTGVSAPQPAQPELPWPFRPVAPLVDFELRPPRPELVAGLQLRLAEVVSSATPASTSAGDQSQWRKWEQFCRLMGTSPWRLDQAAKTQELMQQDISARCSCLLLSLFGDMTLCSLGLVLLLRQNRTVLLLRSWQSVVFIGCAMTLN